MLPLGVDRRINQKSEYKRNIRIQSESQNTIEKLEYISENRSTYKKIKTGETQKHQNTKEKGECSRYTYQLQK